MLTCTIFVSLVHFFSAKTNKAQTIKGIKKVVCALLNDNGGKIEFNFHGGTDVQQSKFKRMIEQSCCIEIMGVQKTVLNVDFQLVENKLLCEVKSAEFFTTINYNLYLPTDTQVVIVPPQEDITDIILNSKRVSREVKHGSHEKKFRSEQSCGFTENKSVQFKCLEVSKTKNTALADRITGVKNKLDHYVSAFANLNGGHIYYGIRDDGVVEGELIPNEQDISEITKKVEKTINKMIWPKEIGQAIKEKHWDIFFEPVMDLNSKPIPSTFVIVVYIAPCFGGVFTEKPESYEVVEGVIKELSFDSWLERVSDPAAELRRRPLEITRRIDISCLTWISIGTKNVCTKAFCNLTVLLNNGDWKGFLREAKKFEEKYSQVVEVQLVVLLKKILAEARQLNFHEAKCLLSEYYDLLPNAKDVVIFEVLGEYVKAALCRPAGDNSEIRDVLINALQIAKSILPGLVTAIVYLLAGTMTNVLDADDRCLCSDVLSNSALQHLQQEDISHLDEGEREVFADFKHRAHITSAASSLGCSLQSGKLVVAHVDNTRLKQAEDHIDAIKRSIKDGYKLTRYREAQFDLLESIKNFRKSEMPKAFDFVDKAKGLAERHQFHEVVNWCKNLQAVYTMSIQMSKR